MRGRMLRLPMAALFAALAVALAITIAACGGSSTTTTTASPGTSDDTIKIGVIVSLTGTYAGLGQPEKNVLEMEATKLNAEGGINGKQVELIFEDDGTDEAKAAAAAAKLIEQEDVVAIIGATGSGQTMAVRGDVQRAAIPQVSMAGATAITTPVDPLVFATPWSNTIVVPFTLDYLKQEKITKIGVITDSGGFGKDGLAVLTADGPKAGVKIVGSETFNPGDSDMTAQLTKLKKTDAQAIVMWTAGKEAAIIAKNMKDLAIDLPLFGSHGIARQEFIAGAGDAAEGVRFAAGKILVPETYGTDTAEYKVATDFITRYKAAYTDAPNTFAGHAYDAFHLVTEAATRVQDDLTPTALRDEIEKTSGFVGIGGTFTMSATDHNGLSQSDLTMYEISGGTWKVVK